MAPYSQALTDAPAGTFLIQVALPEGRSSCRKKQGARPAGPEVSAAARRKGWEKGGQGGQTLARNASALA